MVVRVIFIILLLAPFCFGGECVGCHKPHYEPAGGCVSCHRGNDRTSRKNIAHHGLITARYAAYATEEQHKGRRLVDKSTCRRCHLADQRGNKLAPDLGAKASKKTGEELAASIGDPTDFMPDFGFNEAQREDISRYLLSVATYHGGARQPYAVFVKKGAGENKFEKLCGGCHRALTMKRGPLGVGDTAPNLSGILGDFYRPVRLGAGEKWTAETIRNWVSNPRKMYKYAVMAPLEISDSDLDDVLNILGD